MDIELRGELWDNDSADVLRWWGWRDIVAPMDIRNALDAAGGEDVTILVNSPGGDMTVGGEIRSMLRRYAGKTTALIQGYAASAATLAISACTTIQSEAGALLCYHNPSTVAAGDHREMKRAGEGLKNARDAILEMYLARPGTASREELIKLMDKDIWIAPTQAKEYGLIDEVVGLDGTASDPALFVAAAAGCGRIRLTAEMRDQYLAHVAAEKSAAEKEVRAKRAVARIQALAKF